MSEFLLSGGSTKCCILDIEKENDDEMFINNEYINNDENIFGKSIFENNLYKRMNYKEDKDYIVGNNMVIYG